MATPGCESRFYDLASTDATKAYSVTSYGAKGDGITDDGDAIERAMTAAAGGGQVSFPCGEFFVQSLQGGAPGGRSELFIQGASNVQLVGQGHCSHIFTLLPQRSVFEFATSDHIAVSQLRISAVNAPYVETFGMDGGSAIRFTGVSYGSIDHVEVDGASAGALYMTAGTNHSTLTNNFIHDTYGAGIWEDDCGASNAQNCNPSLPSTNNVYDSNTLTNSTLDALSAIDIDDGNGASNAIVRNNTVSWTYTTVAGNNRVQCIQVNNASGVSIVGNSCTGSPWNGIVITTGPTGSAQNITIQANNIVSSGTSIIGGAGIVVYNAPSGLGVSGFVVQYNNISVAADDGISVYSDGQKNKVSGGQILNNTIATVDQRNPGSSYGVDVQYSDSVTTSSNQISCNGSCIAAGVRFKQTNGATPLSTANTVVDILGPPLLVQ